MQKHIHVIGSSPRSGTTLLNEMMVCCFQVDRHYPHERAIFRTPKPKPGELLVTKRPKDALFMDPIIASNRDVYCIYVVRDPRDVVVSRHGDSGDQYYISLAWWKLVYRQSQQLLQNPRVMKIKYEDLVADPNSVQQQIMDKFPFIRERLLHDFSDYYLYSNASDKAKRAMNQRREVTASSVSNWRKHLPRLAGQLHLYGGISEELKAYGYEADDNWLAELEGVEPDLTRSFSRNELGWFFLTKMVIRRWIYAIRYRLFC